MRSRGPKGVWSESLADHKHRQTAHIGRTALELISRHGLAAVSMRQLADAAGVSRATLYNYFPDVESALLAYLTAEVDDYRADLEESLHGVDDPVERLNHYVTHQIHYLAGDAHRRATAQLQAGALSSELSRILGEHLAGLAETVTRILEDGKATGAFDADLDSDLHTTLLLQLLAGTAAALDSGQTTEQQAVTAVTNLLRHGITAQPHRSTRRS